jgi:lysophospholipase L1-like esterase
MTQRSHASRLLAAALGLHLFSLTGCGSGGGGGGGGGAAPGGAGNLGGGAPIAGTSAAGASSAGTASAGTAQGGSANGGSASGGSSSGGASGVGGSSSAAGAAGAGSGEPAIRWLGRVDARDSKAVKWGWSGAGLLASVRGTKVSVRLQTEGDDASAYFAPVIDGKPGARFAVPRGSAMTVSLGENLSDGPHRVELYRESEGAGGNAIFLGFVDGEVLPPPASPSRLIEIVGDSISAGYGSLGKDVHPPYDQGCAFSLETESVYVSYGALLGRALDAEVSIVARSGWGMYRDFDGDTSNVLPSLFGRTLCSSASPAYDFVRQPDAVLINLGTNDSAPGDPGKPFEDAYVAFLETVRSKYANAWIFLTIGPMTSDPMLGTMRAHLASIVTRLNDPKIATLSVETQDVATTGCDYHPDVDEHERMAKALQTAIKSKLGW